MNVAQEKDFYWNLFKSTFLISAFTVGGGFVIVPLLKAKYVDSYKWLTEKEALDLVAVAQAAPGVVAVNAAVVMGYRLGGVRGMLTAMLATVLPPLITITLIQYFYTSVVGNEYAQVVLKGMQCGATVIIIDVAYNLLKKELGRKLALPILIILGSFIANYLFEINVMYIILINAMIGYVFMQGDKYK